MHTYIVPHPPSSVGTPPPPPLPNWRSVSATEGGRRGGGGSQTETRQQSPGLGPFHQAAVRHRRISQRSAWRQSGRGEGRGGREGRGGEGGRGEEGGAGRLISRPLTCRRWQAEVPTTPIIRRSTAPQTPPPTGPSRTPRAALVTSAPPSSPAPSSPARRPRHQRAILVTSAPPPSPAGGPLTTRAGEIYRRWNYAEIPGYRRTRAEVSAEYRITCMGVRCSLNCRLGIWTWLCCGEFVFVCSRHAVFCVVLCCARHFHHAMSHFNCMILKFNSRNHVPTTDNRNNEYACEDLKEAMSLFRRGRPPVASRLSMPAAVPSPSSSYPTESATRQVPTTGHELIHETYSQMKEKSQQTKA